MRKTKFRAQVLRSTLTRDGSNVTISSDKNKKSEFIYSNGFYFDDYNYWFIIPSNEKYKAIAYAKQEIINIETLGEFVGLKDINGVEIYEGDIFNCGNNAVVKFRSGKFTLVYDNGTAEEMENGLYHYASCKEVIGNIHENKELSGDI